MENPDEYSNQPEKKKEPNPGLDFFERAANPEDFFASTRDKPLPADESAAESPPSSATMGSGNQVDSGFDPAPVQRQRPREAYQHVPASLRPEPPPVDEAEEEREEQEEAKAEAKLSISKKLSAIARKPEPQKKSASRSDDDDDDEEDEETEEEAEVDTVRSDEDLQPILTGGFWQSYFIRARDILVSPRKFFDTMPTTGGYTQPLVFLGVSTAIYSLMEAIGKTNIAVFFSSFFVGFLTTAVGALICHLILERMQGKGTMEGTVRVFAFSKATLLFSWVSAGFIPIGGIIAVIYTVYLNILGVCKIHKIPTKTAALFLIIMAIIGLAARMRLPG